MSATPAPQSQHQAPIATGGYGCVYRPAITCNGVPPPGTASRMAGSVAKLQQVTPTAENEIKIGEMVAGLSNSAQYFVVPESSCTVSAIRFPHTLAETCQPVTEGSTLATEYMVMRMRDVPHHKLGLVPTKSKQSEVQNMLRNLIVGLPHCLEAVVLLQAAENTGQPIVQFDIKADNIFAPDPPRLPLIADFGISFLPLEQTFADAKKLTIAYEPGYYVWPPEMHLLSYLLHSERPGGSDSPLLEEEVVGIAKRVASSNPMLINNQPGVDERANELVAFYMRFAGVNSPAPMVFDFVMSNWDKIDLYSVCMCWGTVLQMYELGKEGEYLAPVVQMLGQGTAADPEQRPLLGQLLAASRRAVDGGAPATIAGLMTVRTKAERNRKSATASLRGIDKALTMLTSRINSVASGGR